MGNSIKKETENDIHYKNYQYNPPTEIQNEQDGDKVVDKVKDRVICTT